MTIVTLCIEIDHGKRSAFVSDHGGAAFILAVCLNSSNYKNPCNDEHYSKGN